MEAELESESESKFELEFELQFELELERLRNGRSAGVTEEMAPKSAARSQVNSARSE